MLSLQRWQQTCGGSQILNLWHQIDFEVNSMVEIIGNANFVQRCESCCDMAKKCDILILTTMSRSAGLWTESWLFGIPGPATRYRLTVSLLSCVLETEDFMLHDIGDPPKVCVGDDLCLLAKRQPGRVRGHGQHAHHVQHQQQVWHQNQVILWTGFNIKSNKTFSSSKRIESPAFCNFCLQGCQRSGEACQRDRWVSILFPIWHLCNSYFQGCWHTGVSSKSDVVDWWQRILFQIWRFSFLCEIPWRWQRPHRCKTFFRQCYLLNVSTPHTRLVP